MLSNNNSRDYFSSRSSGSGSRSNHSSVGSEVQQDVYSVNDGESGSVFSLWLNAKVDEFCTPVCVLTT